MFKWFCNLKRFMMNSKLEMAVLQCWVNELHWVHNHKNQQGNWSDPTCGAKIFWMHLFSAFLNCLDKILKGLDFSCIGTEGNVLDPGQKEKWIFYSIVTVWVTSQLIIGGLYLEKKLLLTCRTLLFVPTHQHQKQTL